MSSPNTFAELVAERRKALNITQAELRDRLEANGVEVSAATVSNWETGETYPRRRVLDQVLDVLEVPPSARDRARLLWAQFVPHDDHQPDGAASLGEAS
jgi:transcriptional regulator with XRE-family HTH domain